MPSSGGAGVVPVFATTSRGSVKRWEWGPGWMSPCGSSAGNGDPDSLQTQIQSTLGSRAHLVVGEKSVSLIRFFSCGFFFSPESFQMSLVDDVAGI